MDDPGHRKIHAQPIPLAGGLAVFTGLACAGVIGLALLPSGWLEAVSAARLWHGLGKRSDQLAVIAGGAFGMLLLGWLDDRYELRPAPKFAGQLLVALATAAAGVRITLFVPNPVFSYAVTVLWILTITNALNFLDNMNGLCAGLGAIAAAWFGFLAAGQGQYLVALIAFAATGALLGFLPYNYPRASVFLGDAGSHLVGYLLAVLAILPHFHTVKHPNPWAVLSPVLVLAVPLVDLVWVVWLRWRLGKPFYMGDTNHVSHRLVRRGFAPVYAVALLWLIAALCGAVTLLL